MRTQKLLAAAAVLAVSVASSIAQPYSQNIVGYANVTLKTGFNMIANPLDSGTNTFSSVLSGVPVGAIAFKFGAGSFSNPNEYYGSGIWDDGSATLNPGEGVFIKSPSDAVVTFVGSVKTGSTTNPIPANFSIRSSIVPQAGGLETDLGFPATGGDLLFFFDPQTQTYSNPYEAFGSGVWDPSQPVLQVGQAFFLNRTGGAGPNWTRNFNP